MRICCNGRGGSDGGRASEGGGHSHWGGCDVVTKETEGRRRGSDSTTTARSTLCLARSAWPLPFRKISVAITARTAPQPAYSDHAPSADPGLFVCLWFAAAVIPSTLTFDSCASLT